MKKDIARLLKKARKAGCVVDSSGKHHKVRCPSGALVTVSKTPSCPRALRAIVGDFKRAGLVFA